MEFHRQQGYDSFFVAEHNHTNGFMTFPRDERYKKVFPGMQIQTKDGVSVLLLASK
jgi:hypothetical protein